MLNQDKVRQIEEYYAQCELEGANEHQVEESQTEMCIRDRSKAARTRKYFHGRTAFFI